MKLTNSFHGCIKRISLLLCIMFSCVATVWAQKTVTGTVVDNLGDPVIGANVLIKGTTRGVTTDIDGKFSINNVSENDILHVTFIGYAAQDLPVAGKNQLSIKLEEENDLLDEVVVVGYGVQKKRDLTGAITSIKPEDITAAPMPNPIESLQGKVAGLDITRSSGQAGASASMKLRGTRSITASEGGNDEPLVLIDGMPGSLTTLNSNDIESIEVLKDASSTAVYGASGANGVIIVTTKSGKAGKTNVNFNAYCGFNGWSKTPEMYNASEFFNLKKQLITHEGTYTTDEDVFNAAIYNSYMAGEQTDWAKELLKTGITQNYSLSVSGGNDVTKGYISFNYSGEDGQYENDNYKVYSTNMKVDHQVRKWLAIGANFQGSFTYKNAAYAKLENALIQKPFGSAYDANGNVNIYPVADSDEASLLVNNHGNYRNQNQNTRLYLNPYIRITPLKGLTFETRANVTLGYSKTNKFEGLGSYKYYNKHTDRDGRTTYNDVYAEVSNNNSYNYKWENILTYNLKINKDHDLTFTGVSSWSHSRREYAYGYADNITANEYLWHNLGAGQNQKSSSSYTMSKGLGFVYRLNYSYKGRYLASASMRHDGSSVLAQDNRWDSFPAYSLGWRISDESWMESTKEWLDNMKIRLGQGVTGTSSISPYKTQAELVQGYAILGNQTVLKYNYPQQIVDPMLGWEKSYNTNIGLDMTVLNNRIDLNLDYYLTNTKDIIWTKKVPVNNGAFSSNAQYETTTNICESKNNGIEVAITGRPFVAERAGDFSWTVNTTFSYSKEELTQFSNDGQNQFISGNKILKEGEPINSFYGYKLDGTWTTAEAADAAVFGAKPGDLKIHCDGVEKVADGQFRELKTDENGSTSYITYDATNPCDAKSYQQVLGHTQPDWTLGIKNSFNYKNFDLSVYCYWRFGQTINYSMLGRYSTGLSNNFPKYFDYATPETLDRSHNYPLMTTHESFNQMDGNGGITYVDGSFFKIKNITLGYTLPKNILKKIKMESVRVYSTITNPLVIAHSDMIEDYDPEMAGSLDYPLTKQLVFGVNVSF